MEIYNKKTNTKLSCSYYSHWIHEIVNKGTVDDYSILKYPDIVNLVMIDANKKTIEEKIIDRIYAESKLKKSPNQYRIVEIDVKKQIQKDILKGKKLNNQSWLFFLIRFKSKIATIKFVKKATIKNIVIGVIIAIIGTVSAYAIMKYGFKWI